MLRIACFQRGSRLVARGLLIRILGLSFSKRKDFSLGQDTFMVCRSLYLAYVFFRVGRYCLQQPQRPRPQQRALHVPKYTVMAKRIASTHKLDSYAPIVMRVELASTTPAGAVERPTGSANYAPRTPTSTVQPASTARACALPPATPTSATRALYPAAPTSMLSLEAAAGHPTRSAKHAPT